MVSGNFILLRFVSRNQVAKKSQYLKNAGAGLPTRIALPWEGPKSFSFLILIFDKSFIFENVSHICEKLQAALDLAGDAPHPLLADAMPPSNGRVGQAAGLQVLDDGRPLDL
jgi:hypothetical protein